MILLRQIEYDFLLNHTYGTILRSLRNRFATNCLLIMALPDKKRQSARTVLSLIAIRKHFSLISCDSLVYLFLIISTKLVNYKQWILVELFLIFIPLSLLVPL